MNLEKVFKYIKRFTLKMKPYGFYGHYNNWQEALSQVKGYDDEKIFEKVLQATLAVKEGKAAYERDSVLFYEPHYDWFLLSQLLHVYSEDNKLHVIDFGGALGSSYFQHKKYLDSLKPFTWHVVEQEKFIALGKKHLPSDTLQFNLTMQEACLDAPINLIMFRCVLPYLEKPYDFLKMAIDLKPKYILIDRNPFVQSEDRICIQKVPKTIIESSYPAWFFNKQKMMSFMANEYELIVSDFDQDVVNINASYEGHLFKRKDND